MEKKLKRIILLFAISISIMSCSSDSDSSSSAETIDYVKDAASLMRNMKLDGEIKNGNVPAPAR